MPISKQIKVKDMKKQKITFTVLKEDEGFSAYTKVDDTNIYAVGETLLELKNDALEAVNFNFEETGTTYLPDDLIFKYDISSVFAAYPVINAKALGDRIGMSKSLLSQYVSGKKKASEKQVQRIMEGIQNVGKELQQIQM
jgi:transcriptional regulator with XRE-family HTH domain